MDYGIDISAIPDLSFQLKSGRANLAEAIARRLSTPRGGLFYAPDYGMDLRSYLNEVLTDQTRYEIESLTAAECEADERIVEATASIIGEQYDPRSIKLVIRLTTVDDKFELILSVDSVSVEALYANA